MAVWNRVSFTGYGWSQCAKRCDAIWLHFRFFGVKLHGPSLCDALQNWLALLVWGQRLRVVQRARSVFQSTWNLAGHSISPFSPYWVDEDLHPSIHLSVTQQDSVFSYFALHPPLPYFPLVIYCLYPVTVIYPVLIFSCGEKKKNLNVTTLTHSEHAHPHNPSTRMPRFKKEAWMLRNGKCFDPNKTPSMEKGAIWYLFCSLSLPKINASSVCSGTTQLTQRPSFNVLASSIFYPVMPLPKPTWL